MSARGQIVVAPHHQPYLYVPLSLDLDPGVALLSLSALSEPDALRQIGQMVDPVALSRIGERAGQVLGLSSFLGVDSPGERARLALVEKACKSLLKRVRVRRERANDLGVNKARLDGEALQRKDEHPLSKISAREKERSIHADRLWSDCGVLTDVEMSPWVESVDGTLEKDQEALEHIALNGSRKIDSVDELAAKIRKSRQAVHMSSFEFPLAIAQRDIVLNLALVARALADRGSFGVFPGEIRVGPTRVDGPFALSWIRELRFFGHGQLGRAAKEGVAAVPAGFGFDGTMLTTDVLSHPDTRAVFAPVSFFMAPGSSVLFEGCDTGSGSEGRAFVEAAAQAFFGKQKWGYVRANTVVTSADPIAVERGIRDGAPVTLKWPDDF